MAAISSMIALGVGAAGLASSAMGASAANKAAKQQSKQANNAIAEQRRQFDLSLSYLDPIYQDAEIARSFYMTALGLYPDTNYRPPSGVPAPTTQGGPAPKPASPFGNGPIGNAAREAMGDPQDFVTNPAQQPGQPAPYTPGQTQSDIVSMVQNSPGYQTQLQTGIDTIDRAAQGGQGLTSGRRMMALNDYGQGTFGSFYNQWLDRVGGVAQQGTQAAGAIAGQSQAVANNVGNLMTQKGNAQATGTMNAASSWQQGINDVAGAAGWFTGQRPMTGGGL